MVLAVHFQISLLTIIVGLRTAECMCISTAQILAAEYPINGHSPIFKLCNWRDYSFQSFFGTPGENPYFFRQKQAYNNFTVIFLHSWKISSLKHAHKGHNAVSNSFALNISYYRLFCCTFQINKYYWFRTCNVLNPSEDASASNLHSQHCWLIAVEAKS